MTKTKRIQILCLLGAVTLLLSGCWTEAPVESANGLLGDQEPADQQEEVILPAAFTLPYDPDQTLDPVTCADGMQQVAGSLIYEGLFRLDRQLEPQPWLCQSYTYDAASLTYTFTLRSGVTFSDVIRRTIPVLGEAADMAGGPQLRAVGTIGGNVCNGVTSADSAPTLMALDVRMHLRGPAGWRIVPISQWYQGVGKVDLGPAELLCRIVIPKENYDGWSGHYIKYAQRNAMDIATLGVSCLVKLTSDKKMVDDAALAFGVAGPVPMRSPAAEAAVRGLPIGEAVAAIGEAALADVNPRTSWRASKEFRIQLVKELSGRVLREAARKGGAAL